MNPVKGMDGAIENTGLDIAQVAGTFYQVVHPYASRICWSMTNAEDLTKKEVRIKCKFGVTAQYERWQDYLLEIRILLYFLSALDQG